MSRRSRLPALLAVISGLPLSAAPAFGAAEAFASSSGSDPSWWRVVGALAVCLGLAVLAAFALQARQGVPLGFRLPLARRGASRLEVVETVRIAPSIHVCLLKCDGDTLLLSAGPTGCTVLRDDRATAGEGP